MTDSHQALARSPISTITVRPARQVQQLTRTLTILDHAGVDGIYVFTFVHPLNPRHDLDRASARARASASLATSYEHHQGTTYPDMIWGPKPAFTALASYYASQKADTARQPFQAWNLRAASAGR